MSLLCKHRVGTRPLEPNTLPTSDQTTLPPTESHTHAHTHPRHPPIPIHTPPSSWASSMNRTNGGFWCAWAVGFLELEVPSWACPLFHLPDQKMHIQELTSLATAWHIALGKIRYDATYSQILKAQDLQKILDLKLFFFNKNHQFRPTIKYLGWLDLCDHCLSCLTKLWDTHPQDSRDRIWESGLLQFPQQDDDKIKTRKHWPERKLTWLLNRTWLLQQSGSPQG